MKTHPDIPEGMYCYHYVGPLNESGIPTTKYVCPFWKKIEGGARCELLKVNSVNEEFGSLIWDQVKECGINEYEDEP